MQTSLERALVGQSKNLFNLTVEGNGPVGSPTRLLFNYFGDRISEAGANEAPDIIEQGRGTVDVVFSQRVRAAHASAQPREPDRQPTTASRRAPRTSACSSSAERSRVSFGYSLF